MIELLKNRKNGFDNLYLRIDGGYPVQVKLSFWNAKVMRFLLAKATPVEFSKSIDVREADAKNTKIDGDAIGNYDRKSVQMNLTGCEVQDDGK